MDVMSIMRAKIAVRNLSELFATSNRMRTHGIDFLALKHHPVTDLTKSIDFNLDDVSILEPCWRLHESCNSAGCPGHNYSARCERMASRCESYDVLDIENQIIDAGPLPLGSVDRCDHCQALWIWDLCRRTDNGPKWCKLVEALRIACLLGTSLWSLPISRRDVVSYGVSKYVFKRIFIVRQVFARLSDDHAKLSLGTTCQQPIPARFERPTS